MTFTVPDRFAARLTHALGEPARHWLAGLPALVEKYLARWSLHRDGPPRHGFTALVLPVRRADGTPTALKLMCPNEEGEHEALALSIWDGAGAVRLLAHDKWVMLLERLDDTRCLRDEPIDEALAVIAGFIRRLDVPAPPEVRTLRSLAARWVRDLPRECADRVPPRFVEAAVGYCESLGPRAGNRLVNEDLHYENVLAGAREPWLVIDPKPIAGDPEFGLVLLLWNRFDGRAAERLDKVCHLAGLDAELARRWALVRTVDAWADAGEFPTVELCARVAAAMLPGR
jgi:streptomycin 6-kinase